MLQIQNIVESVGLENSESVMQALQKMRSVPEHELHLDLVIRDTFQSTSVDTRKTIMLAQVESDRRKSNATRNLAYVTTMLSGAGGIFGVFLELT
jgi:hypothetical protein